MEKNMGKYDFAGWATRFNVKCSDGRIIKPEAFSHSDGLKVPLVWNHNHSEPTNVLGHAILEKRAEGIYAYGYFNDTYNAKESKKALLHGDIDALSIMANNLKQKDTPSGREVTHGIIREVSLVLAGANPGAFIHTVMVHNVDGGEEAYEDAIIHNASETLDIQHAAKDEDEPAKKPEDKKPEEENTTQKPEKEPEKKEPEKKENPMADETKAKTVQEVFDTLNEEQKTVVYAMIGAALEEKEGNKGDNNVKHNAFDQTNDETTNEDNVLTHAQFAEIMGDAKKMGSAKQAFLEHSITNVQELFPDAKALSGMPETINDDTTWVRQVMNAVKKTPFSRIKSIHLDITGENARAKGYVKGEQKVEEVIAAAKRSTTPTTIYKMQKMDRDDVLDITDFDVIAYLKREMRGKLDEEIARAILIGDGRSGSDDDKINPLNLRPILGDNALYAVKKIITREAGVTDAVFAKNFIKDVVRARKEYKGSGNPSLFTTEDMLTEMLLIEDVNGRAIYDTIEKLKTALRVKEIVTVIPMENLVRVDANAEFDYLPLGILVNLIDYSVGADKGGEVNFFEDFDLNFNKQEYLIETRISGALIKPYSAVTFELKRAHVAG